MFRTEHKRWHSSALLMAMLATLLSVRPTAAQSTALCFPNVPGITNCIEGRFREYWEQNGGLAVFGYPITAATNEVNRDTGQTYLTQWFERNRFELHPENSAPYDVLLGRLGDDRLRQQGRDWQTFPKAAPSAPHYFAQTGHAIAHQPFWRYWSTHGLEFDGRRGVSFAESLALFGYPVSEAAMETNTSGHTVLTQWFERARFEWHPANAEEFRVLLGLLGNEVRVDRTQGSAPEPLVALNGAIYFGADDGRHGRELWRSDGTAQGTHLVKDLVPGATSGHPLPIATINGALVFTAATAGQGRELWRSDGTASGTFLLRDIWPGPQDSVPRQFRPAGNTLFFIADDSQSGQELWKTDGTVEGTVRVKDIRPGPQGSTPAQPERNSSFPWSLTDVNGTLYFVADDGANGSQIWRSDGTEAGTQRVTNPAAGYAVPAGLIDVDGTLFFTWVRTTGSPQLWKTDGTAGGTRLVKDWGDTIAQGRRPELLVNAGGTLYFVLDTAGRGAELWKSDGTVEGTVLVKEINPGPNGSLIVGLTAMRGMVFFKAWEGQRPGLWRSDGTAEGTIAIKQANVEPLIGSDFALTFPMLDDRLIFSVAPSGAANPAREIWRTDGSPCGTTKLAGLPAGTGTSGPGAHVARGNQLFFAYDDGTHGSELWRSDLTQEGTTLVRDINTQQ